MAKLISESGVSSLEFVVASNRDDRAYEKSVCLSVRFANVVSTTYLSQIWFYLGDIEKFQISLRNGLDGSLVWEAISEFKMTIAKADTLGHVTINLVLEDFASETKVLSCFESSAGDVASFLDAVVREAQNP